MFFRFFISRPNIPKVEIFKKFQKIPKMQKIQKIIVTIKQNTSELVYLEQLYQGLEIRDANPDKKVVFRPFVSKS
jgi:hypothetical protein